MRVSVLEYTVGSFGSTYLKSVAVRYSPDTLYASLLSAKMPALRKLARTSERSPPSTVSVVPADWNGDFVITWSTPLPEFGPYRAAAGPWRTSMRSMSSVVPVASSGTFTRSDGTPAYR